MKPGSDLPIYPTRFDILDTANLNKKYGVKGAPGDTFNDGLDHGLARFSPAGCNEIGSRSFWPNRNWRDHFQFNDNVLMQRGKHGLKPGVEFRRTDVFREAQRFRRGRFVFSKVLTAQNLMTLPLAQPPETGLPTCCSAGPARRKLEINSVSQLPGRSTE
jgi:hypothetical protein